LLQLVALLLLVGLLLCGLIWLGAYAREQLREHERFQVAFADIECNPPAPLQRPEFLEEVRYHGRLPERFSIFEDGLSDRLQIGFAQHPWVARVDKVELAAPRSVRVALVYRQPVLAVVVTPDLAAKHSPPLPVGERGRGEGLADDPAKLPLRAVDDQGVLLPKNVPLPRGLPILYRAPRPGGGAGRPWGDPGVLAAAQMAVLLKPPLFSTPLPVGERGEERVEIKAMTWSEQGLILWGAGFKVLWGRPPELAKGEEAATVVKEQRLMALLAKLKPLGSRWPWMHEYDVRPREAMTDRLVLWERP